MGDNIVHVFNNGDEIEIEKHVQNYWCLLAGPPKVKGNYVRLRNGNKAICWVRVDADAGGYSKNEEVPVAEDPVHNEYTRQMYYCKVSEDGAEEKWAPLTIEQSLAIVYGKQYNKETVSWFATRFTRDRGYVEDDYKVDLGKMVQVNERTGHERPLRESVDATEVEILAEELEAVHVTRAENKESILKNGLDPNFGGKKGGASDAFKKKNAGAGAMFAKHSGGKVHMTAVHVNSSLGEDDHTDGSDFYFRFYEDMGMSPVRLYVYAVSQDFERDPDDAAAGRQRTYDKVEAECISEERYNDMDDEDPKKLAIKARLRELAEKVGNDIEEQIKNTGRLRKSEGQRMGSLGDDLSNIERPKDEGDEGAIKTSEMIEYEGYEYVAIDEGKPIPKSYELVNKTFQKSRQLVRRKIVNMVS